MNSQARLPSQKANQKTPGQRLAEGYTVACFIASVTKVVCHLVCNVLDYIVIVLIIFTAHM